MTTDPKERPTFERVVEVLEGLLLAEESEPQYDAYQEEEQA